MNPLFIIPARGGSKGIPRKNIKILAGRPLIHYSIDVARALAADDAHVVVSTDDDEIAAVAELTGLPVTYRRPAYLATDTAGSREVILDVMDMADARGIDYDCVVLLQPTSPLRTVDDVKACMERYTPDIDMVVTVKEAACNPYYDCFETDPTTGYLHVSKGDGLLTRRQDAPRAWQYNGAVYIINPQSIRQMALGAMPRRIPVEMPRSRSIDLDTPLDWTIAESLMNQ
ncbi:MAG: acylneuraminate cytidylyltransferase family protein [Lachnoclostridium sp.]|nr:acylneuraminate cytidylyltransferase family protein [Lachnoclostridium sp.]